MGMLRKIVLACGLLSSVLYVAMNVFVASQWPGYSSVSQVVSELSAIDSPTRALWLPLGYAWGALFLAFAWGVWRWADRRPLRIAGAVLMAYALFGFFWPPMHLRPVLAAGGGTLTDTLHIVWTAVSGVLLVLAMSFAATAFGIRFRVYTIASIVLILAFGWVTGTYASALQANLPTPWVGVWERLLIGLQMLWIAVLSTLLLRRPGTAAITSRQGPGFKSSAGEAAFMTAYDAAMKHWPVPYEEFDIPSRFGSTHVIACGPKGGASPLVLLHGYMATSVMWAPNVGDLSRRFRVYAIDVMGQPGKSIPLDPIRSGIDYVMWLNTTLYGLGINRFSLAGQSFGGWLALKYAIAEPDRVEKLVLLSPGGLLQLSRQFTVRGMLMTLWPTRFTVNSFMRWLGLTDAPGKTDVGLVRELVYLGMKHFRFAPETLRVTPTAFSHGELTTINPPTLVLIGERDVIYNPAKALARALRLIPDVRGTLIPDVSHDMVFSQRHVVDAQMVDFLSGADANESGKARERAVA